MESSISMKIKTVKVSTAKPNVKPPTVDKSLGVDQDPDLMFHHCHRQSTMPPWLRRACNFVRPRLPPIANEADPTTTTLPVTANLSARPQSFRRCNRCLLSTASDEDLVLPGEILTVSGEHLLFCGRSAVVDTDWSRL